VRLATASGDRTIKVWDSSTGKVSLNLSASDEVWMHAAWSPDGRQLAAGSTDGSVFIWEIESKSAPRRLLDSGHKYAIAALAWSPDGKQLVTASGGRTVIWNVGSFTKAATLTHDDTSEAILDVQWSKDGKRLATGSSVGKVMVWDAETHKELASVPGLLGRATSVAWSPGGGQLAIGSNDWVAMIWDPQVKTELLTLPGHTGGVTRLAWSPDGKRLATAAEDGTILIHTVSVRELMTLAAKRVTRTLTSDDCWNYLKETKCPPFPSIPPK
jgi:WD40 repeat protein